MSTAAPLLTAAPKSSVTGGANLVLQRKCACGNAASSLTGECEDCQRKKSFGLQPKLRIGSTDDPLEREADRVADQVMRMPEPALQRQPEDEEDEELLQSKPLVQRKSFAAQDREAEPLASVHELLRSPGQPLGTAERQFFEPRFGHDFGQVRVHTNALAGESARAFHARAYTVGRNIAFSEGQYSPGTAEGKRLLAHELTHVVQQGGGGSTGFNAGSRKRGLSPNTGPNTAGLETVVCPRISPPNTAPEYRPNTVSPNTCPNTLHQTDSPAGRKLLAHELTHAVQQGAVGVIRRQPTEREQPTLEEQAETVKGMFARFVERADRRGVPLIVFRVEHRGTWLSPNLMESVGKPAESRSARSPMTEAQASRHLAAVFESVVAAKPGEWEIEFRRDPRGVLQFQSWKKISRVTATSGNTNDVTSVASGGECNESDSNYGQCLSEERRRAYQEGILAAGEVAEAYYNPFSGGGGVPDFGAFKLWRLRRVRQVAESRVRRHSGAGVPYRVIGPHGRLQGTSVYVLRDSSGTVLYVGKGETMNRLRSHIADPKKTDWFGEIAGVEVRATGLNNTQALALEENLIGQMKPLYNKDLTPFQKEFGTTLSLSTNLPKSQQSLWFHVILGG